jgi:hypothetical protein
MTKVLACLVNFYKMAVKSAKAFCCTEPNKTVFTFSNRSGTIYRQAIFFTNGHRLIKFVLRGNAAHNVAGSDDQQYRFADLHGDGLA